MFHPKQDIFSQSWLDVIFEGRNKQYGAYVLRKDASKNASVALFVCLHRICHCTSCSINQKQAVPGHGQPRHPRSF